MRCRSGEAPRTAIDSGQKKLWSGWLVIGTAFFKLVVYVSVPRYGRIWMDWIPKGFTTEHTKNHGDARRIFASMGHAPDTNMVLVPWIWSHLFRENHGNSMESPDTCILVLYSSAAAAAV